MHKIYQVRTIRTHYYQATSPEFSRFFIINIASVHTPGHLFTIAVSRDHPKRIAE